ncbi:hypothetical protein FB45DRAFT_1063770 [Roridomyces roridus]|uniref:NmrA-like domain-containing protein n=1 Tax=Roridomyces roridus TaxID=1738132 RepID=A0AAD7BCU2_9AGAR|nr:hypothetical protein FB45DRAFT_1063770 [Roridomyces roridus]
MAAPSVLVIGASGSVGAPLVKEFLRQRSRFGRIGILADPSKAHKFEDAKKGGVEIVVGSFLDYKCYQGFDVVISLAGNTFQRLQPAMIEAAVAAGVRHFYPSEFGIDFDRADVQNLRFFRDRIVTRNHLAATAKTHSDFRYTLIVTGQFSQWAYSKICGIDVENHVVEAYGTPEAEISVTALEDIVRYTVDSVLLPFPQGTSRRQLCVRGDHMTFAQLITLLEDVQGVKYRVTYHDPTVAIEKQEEARQRGDEYDELLWAVRWQVGSSGLVTVNEPLDNTKFDFKPETLRETMLRTLKTEDGPRFRQTI